jgi:hypothetical protein
VDFFLLARDWKSRVERHRSGGSFYTFKTSSYGNPLPIQNPKSKIQNGMRGFELMAQHPALPYNLVFHQTFGPTQPKKALST